MLTKYIIDKDMNTDATGKIFQINYNTIEAKKNLIDLYFSTGSNEIPFKNYGNDLIVHVFEVINDTNANGIIKEIVTFITENFGVYITKYDYKIDWIKRKISLYLLVENNQTIEIPITYNTSMVDNGLPVDREVTYLPIPGNNGIITITKLTTTSVKLEWTIASTNYVYGRKLYYQVYISNSSNIDTLENVLVHGTILQSYAKNILEYTVTGLTPGYNYFYNVVVKDEKEFSAIYTMNSYQM